MGIKTCPRTTRCRPEIIAQQFTAPSSKRTAKAPGQFSNITYKLNDETYRNRTVSSWLNVEHESEMAQEFAAKHREDGFTGEQCAQHLVDEKKASHGQGLKIQVGKVMTKMGWQAKKIRSREHAGGRVRKYFPPQESGVTPKPTNSNLAGLHFCDKCKHLSPLSNSLDKGLCTKQNNKHVHRFTHQQGGCELYEAKPGMS